MKRAHAFLWQYFVRPYYNVVLKLGGPNYLDELDFWDRVLSSCPSTYFDPIIRQKAFPQVMRSCLNELESLDGQQASVLELGSGPVSLLMAGVDEGMIEVVAVDPLARTYSQLLKKYDLSFPIKPINGYGEDLRRFLPERTFDLGYSSNALDHTTSPKQCLIQMTESIHSGGYLILEGFVREGSQGDWIGLHKHDLYLEGERLMHQDMRGEETNLCEGLPLECISQNVQQFSARSIDAFGYETDEDMPADASWNWLNRDWYTIVYRKL